MKQVPEAAIWDKQYQEAGRYPKDEPPVAFVKDILDELGEEGKSQFGLYVCCGNGRNFIPLLRSGLNLRGYDISPVAITQLVERCPEAEGKVWVSSFDHWRSSRIFDYVVAIQVFQHGDQARTHEYFRIAADTLKPGGKLFLRVNSISTDIKHEHEVVDKKDKRGLSVLYKEGPKEGSIIHYFSGQELEDLAQTNKFEIIQPLVERVESRHEQADGTWAQWESVWQKA